MHYSIGEVAQATQIPISTLRYYDREGMFPGMARSQGGIRAFSNQEIDTIKVIECLKTSGMSIQEIKQFLQLCQQGDASLQARRDMFYERHAAVQAQIEALQNTLHTLKYKCWYYDTALAAGTEEKVKQMPVDAIPADVREHRI